MEVRTEREPNRRRREAADLLLLPRSAKSVRNGAGFSRKTLAEKPSSILGLLKRKEWPRCHRESSWQVRQSRVCEDEKEQSIRS